MTNEEIKKLLAEATPGPWRADDRSADDVVVWGPKSHGREDGLLIGNVGHSNPSEVSVIFDVHAADARLIAAAPDLAAEVLRLRAEGSWLVKALGVHLRMHDRECGDDFIHPHRRVIRMALDAALAAFAVESSEAKRSDEPGTGGQK